MRSFLNAIKLNKTHLHQLDSYAPPYYHMAKVAKASLFDQIEEVLRVSWRVAVEMYFVRNSTMSL